MSIKMFKAMKIRDKLWKTTFGGRGPLVEDILHIAFFMSCLMLRNLDLPFFLLFSMSLVLPSTICLVSWIPWIQVLCSPANIT